MNKQLLPLPSCMCMCQHRSEVYVKEKGTLYSKSGGKDSQLDRVVPVRFCFNKGF